MRPERVTVLGQPFDVEYRGPDHLDLGKEHAMGRTSLSRLRIVVDSDMHPHQLRDTVLHEVLHACNLVIDPAADDEEQVARLTPVLLDVMRSNPDVVAWLMA